MDCHPPPAQMEIWTTKSKNRQVRLHESSESKQQWMTVPHEYNAI